MPPLKKLVFGRSFTDHMLEIDWNVQKGWRKPRIVPYGNLSISPASTGLHYGIQVRVSISLLKFIF
jgi:branched-chain amino acid aminotransferase